MWGDGLEHPQRRLVPDGIFVQGEELEQYHRGEAVAVGALWGIGDALREPSYPPSNEMR